MTNFHKVFATKKTIIGMIHLPALLGYSKFKDMKYVIEFALEELHNLEQGKINGVLIENEGDQPHNVLAAPETIAATSIIAKEVVSKASIPVGIEILLNDPKASFAVAKAAGLQFIRSDYFVDRMSRPEYGGEMHINPSELMTYRKKIAAEEILILTDLQVKYAKMLEVSKSISLSVKQATAAGSDGVIISGNFTGEEPDLGILREAWQASTALPVLVGSGFSAANAKELLNYSHGAIVGSSLKNSSDRIDKAKVKEMMNIVNN